MTALKLTLAIALLTSVSAFDGTSSKDGITVRFRNNGKFAISRVEMNCDVRGRPEPMRCREDTPMFFPGTDYTATFYYPHLPRAVRLSIKQLAMSNGTIYNPRLDDLSMALCRSGRSRCCTVRASSRMSSRSQLLRCTQRQALESRTENGAWRAA